MATVIFKPTEACNARCAYCDVVHKESHSVKTMTKDILELFFIRINEYLLENSRETLEIIWHGGEPLLLGPEYFETALEFQNKHCLGVSSRIHHSIQSNLTLLTLDLIKILKKIGVRSIGSSYDPFSNLRGLGSNVDSAEYNRRFMEGVALLEKEDMGCGIIYVVTKQSLDKPLDIFYHLSNFCIDGAVNLNPVIIYDDKLKHLEITPEEYTDFLGTIFPVWWENRSRYPHIGPFSSLVRNLLEGERKLSCNDSGDCANSHINLAPDGMLSQCGRSSDWNLLDYGSIRDTTFSQVFANPQRKILLDRNLVLSQGECNGCRFWDICHGGCPLDAWYKTGSFLHKSFLCSAKKDFIEKYVEPVIHKRSDADISRFFESPSIESKPATEVSCSGSAQEISDDEMNPGEWSNYSREMIWINPVGGLGDTLMLSGVLKQVISQNRTQKFNLIKRTKYGSILEGHPAIEHIGFPPPGAELITTAYWDEPGYHTGQRAYQILASMFGLTTPVEESLYVPWSIEDDAFLVNFIPFQKRNIIIAPASESPRKQVEIKQWEVLVEKLRQDGVFVVQVGKQSDLYVRGAFSLLGLTNIRQLVSLLSKFDAVVTSDNFVMHAAHMCSIPSIVLWGPTSNKVYGYEGHLHYQAQPECTLQDCIGAGRGHLYSSQCQEQVHCMNQIDMESVYQSVLNICNTSF